jgi:hypothetical protein
METRPDSGAILRAVAGNVKAAYNVVPCGMALGS